LKLFENIAWVQFFNHSVFMVADTSVIRV